MKNCKAIVATCIDFRFQKAINQWLVNQGLEGDFDRLAAAGATKDPDFLREQLTLSQKLHKITTVYLLSHEDCGAFNHDAQAAKDSLNAAEKMMAGEFSELKVFKFFITLDGQFQPLQ